MKLAIVTYKAELYNLSLVIKFIPEYHVNPVKIFHLKRNVFYEKPICRSHRIRLLG